MRFLEKRYNACAYAGHYVDDPSCYDREACDGANKQGEIGLYDEVHTKYEPAFKSPLCKLCTQSEYSLRDCFREPFGGATLQASLD